MTTATIVRMVSNSAVLARASEIKARVEAPGKAKARAGEVLSSPDLRTRSSAIMGALKALGVKIDGPPAEGPALAAWVESASAILALNSAEPVKRPAQKRGVPKVGTSLGLTPAQRASLGLK